MYYEYSSCFNRDMTYVAWKESYFFPPSICQILSSLADIHIFAASLVARSIQSVSEKVGALLGVNSPAQK
jgi:hypothetical protein